MPRADSLVSARPKVIQVVESFAYGTAKSVKQLCGFLKQDFDIEVFYCERDGTEQELKSIDPDIKWTPLNAKGPLKHARNIHFIRSRIDSQCQAVHGHSSYGGLYVRLASLGKAVPHVFFSPRGYAFLREDMHWAKRAVFLTAEFLLSFFGTTVACGPSEYRVGQRFSRRIVNINNAIALQQHAELNSNREFCVLSIGRIAPQKGFDIFLEVAGRLPDIRFTWVGSCEDEYCEKTLAATGGLPANVELIDYMPQQQLFATMRAQSVIMHPSRWEGLSRVLLESLAMGKPLITSKYPANLDCLQALDTQQYANGFACETPQEYADAIVALQADKALLKTMAAASHRMAAQQFDIRVISQQWLSLYKA